MWTLSPVGAALGNAPQGRLLEKELEEVGVDHREQLPEGKSQGVSLGHSVTCHTACVWTHLCGSAGGYRNRKIPCLPDSSQGGHFDSGLGGVENRTLQTMQQFPRLHAFCSKEELASLRDNAFACGLSPRDEDWSGLRNLLNLDV